MTLSGIDQVSADEVVKEAHNVCPYSNATRGNIEVSVIAKIS
jgi:osmotically inducible protein OsmC